MDSLKDTVDIIGIYANQERYSHWANYFRGIFVMTCNLVYFFLVEEPTPKDCCTTNSKSLNY